MQEQNQQLMCRPKCNAHDTIMELRTGTLTYEEQFCGTWYDCQYPGCHASVLYPSQQLQEQLQRN